MGRDDDSREGTIPEDVSGGEAVRDLRDNAAYIAGYAQGYKNANKKKESQLKWYNTQREELLEEIQVLKEEIRHLRKVVMAEGATDGGGTIAP